MSLLSTDAVLLVVDVQQGFDDTGHWGRRDNPAAEDNIAALLGAWRRSGRPVVLVRHDSAEPGSPLAPAAPGNALRPLVAAELGGAEPDLLVSKQVNSAFYGTPDLNGWLRDNGLRQLVVVGVQTNMCCETTARMAGNLGFDVLFAGDATHTFDAYGPDGRRVAAADLARATAASLHHGGFARVVSTAELLAAAETPEAA